MGVGLLIAAFIVQYVRGIDFDDLRGTRVSWTWMLLASLVGVLARYWGVIVWRGIMRELGAVDLPSFPVLASVYSKAWLGRYVPGKVTWIAGKVYFGRQHGLSTSRLAVSSVLEAQVQIVLYLIVSLLVLAVGGELDRFEGAGRWWLIAGALALAISVVPQCFNAMLRLADRILKGRVGSDVRVSGRLVAIAAGLHCVGFLASGVSYALLTRSITSLDFTEAWFVVAVFNLAGAVGVLALIAPSGLGVREGVQLLLLPSIMSEAIALLITVVARLWSVIMDVLFFVVAATIAAIASRPSA